MLIDLLDKDRKLMLSDLLETMYIKHTIIMTRSI
jgi:hypothetical protein